jgi:hypothetical protein
LIAGNSHALGLIRTRPAQQAFSKPSRQGMAQRQTFGRWVWHRQGLAGFLGAKGRAEDTIHNGRELGEPVTLRQLHRGVYRCCCRDALHAQHLVQAQMQEPSQAGRLFMGWNFAETIEPTIQPLTPANASVSKLGRQAAIRWRQGILAKGPL